MSSLTAEQRQRIEENRRKALELRAKAQQNRSQNVTTHNTPPKASIPGFSKNWNSNIPPKVVVATKTDTTAYARLNKPTSQFFSAKKDNTKTWNVTSDPLTGICTLISRDRFSVQIPFNSKVIDLFKTIPGKQYDTNSRNWNFPLEEYEKLKQVVAPLAPNIVLGNLPKSILQSFLGNGKPRNKEDYRTVSLDPIEKKLVETLFPFQKEGVQFGIMKKGKCLIADEMGLGKTIQALGIADYYSDDWPLLIVCPSSMRYQWQEEIQRYLPNVPTYKIYIVNSKKDFVEGAKIVIISYDLMGKQKEYLKSLGFGVIIIDESHSLKSAKAQRTKAALELIRKAKRCILLSGTPALSRPAELFCQIKALHRYLFKDMIEFGVRYCDGKQDRFGWNFNGSSNLLELKLLLEEEIMIRRLKADVLDQLPSKLRKVVILSNDSIDLNTKSMHAFAKKLNQDSIKGLEKRSTLLSYFAETGKAKIRAICEHVEKLLEQNKKFLVFGHHREVLDAICQVLEKKETYYIRIDGKVNSEERKDVCDQFQEEEQYRVAVLSIKAANTGITLTSAQLIVFAELYWNPGELIQAEDRAHRIGQRDSVLVQYLIAKGTADDYLWPLVQSKLNVLQKVGLSDEKELSNAMEEVTESQPKITNFFSDMFDNDGIDEADFASILDEIEGVPEKKMRME